MNGGEWTPFESRKEAHTVEARNEARVTKPSEGSGKAGKKPKNPEQLKLLRQIQKEIKEMKHEVTLRILKNKGEAREKARRKGREEVG